MINALIAWCARHKWTTLGITLALCLWALNSLRQIPIDAIPDLSDTQVIVYSRWDRAPDVIENQVSYPIVQALLGTPKVKNIRAFSDYGYSYVYAIFQDGTDLYWARSRVLEYLAKIQGSLPEGVKMELGPDATGVGWVYQYALVDKTGKHSLAELRSLQDWKLRFELGSVPGVAEVASVGGFVKQLQVKVNPLKLQAFAVGLMDVVKAARESNVEMGGKVLEFNSGFEFMVRGRGWVKGPEDLGAAPLRTDPKTGAVVRIRDVAEVAWGSDMRRGVTDLDGEGEAVGGVIVMRHGENAPEVIERVKARLEEIKPSLPKGVELVTVYDRSSLIKRAIATIQHELLLEMIVVSLVIALFLWHIPSSLIPIATLPISVLLAFIPMHYLGVSANIMSLAGIAVAIGAMVDASIVVVENSHKRLEQWMENGRKGDYKEVLVSAIQEVARPSFFSLLIIAVSFLPVFALTDMEGRLFKPLAFTKNLSMMVAAVLAITLDPAMRLAFIRLDPIHLKNRFLNWAANGLLVGKMHKEEEHPVSRRLYAWYHPIVDLVLKRPALTIGISVLLLLGTAWPALKLGSEFMPSLDEGDLLYMPTALPGMSANEAGRILQRQDLLLKQFPEVERVFGKAGRAESSTDVAPFSMVETTVMLKPKDQWPDPSKTTYALSREMNEKLKFAGIPNIWTMPIKNRIDMLSTGVRTPLGIKVLGDDLASIEKAAVEIETLLRGMEGTRNVVAERAAGGYFLDVEWNREALGRYGLSMEEAQMAFSTAFGGESISQVVLGRERYGMAVRYMPDFREDEEDLKRVLLTPMKGMANAGGPTEAVVALGQLATVRKLEGPAMIRNEDGRLAAYVYVDIDGVDFGTYVQGAKKLVAEKAVIPTGVSLRFSGQYENMERVKQTLKWMVPLTLLLVVMLLYFNSHSWTRTGIVLLAVPFSLIGAVWLLWALDYNMSVAVWVGLIALAGLDAETGMFMLLYLELAFHESEKEGKFSGDPEKARLALVEAIHHGAVKRVRPKVMTVACAFVGLLPIMVSTGSGADVMKRIAAPMVGGLFSSFLLELIVYPAVYYLWKWNAELLPNAEGRPPRGIWNLLHKLG